MPKIKPAPSAKPDSALVKFRVFRTGNSLAIRLPRTLGFKDGEEFVGVRLQQGLLLRAIESLGWPEGYSDGWDRMDLPPRGGK